MRAHVGLVATLLVALAPQPARPPTPTPGARFGHSLVYDSHEQRVVLIDGYTWVRAVSPADPPEHTELWTWDGVRWARLAGTGPVSRTMARAVYDAARGRIVSFGGRVGGSEAPSNETWAWTDGNWRKLADAAAGPNVHFEMTYDVARDTIVRYGGALPVAGGFAWPTTTWILNGATWISVATDGPVGRAASQMVYDSRRREVVLFGGQGEAPARGAPQPVFGDTWIWNGVKWRPGPAEGPTPRSFHAMSFDSRTGLVLVHGGARGDEVLSDLWAWDGMRWTAVPQPGDNPGRRRLHAMAYDAARNRTVLYGGVGPDRSGATRAYDDTWEWDGHHWSRRPEE